MNVNLHPYQEYCVGFVDDKPSTLLLLEPGLGKTLITLTHLANQKMLGALGKVLIIAPLSVAKHTWTSEIEKWDIGLTYSQILGDQKTREAALQKKADLYIINKENVPWLVAKYAQWWDFDTLIIDELSAFKASNTSRFKALRKIRPKIKRFIGLTGTPAPNSLLDLWSQVYIADGGERLGKFKTQYKRDHFRLGRLRNGAYKDYRFDSSYEVMPGHEDIIHKKISDIAVSMKSKDYLNLPPRIDNIVNIELEPRQLAGYKKFAKELVLDLPEGELTAANAAILSNKLMQYANGAVYDEDGNTQRIHTAKIAALSNIVNESQGEQVLVFYNYKHDVERIKEFIPEAEMLDVKRFQSGEQRIALAHPASAGHGLNLQVSGAHIIVWFGMTWSLELYQQANARLDRQGQKNTVVVHHLVAKRTVDERAMQVLEGKEERQDALMEAVKAIVNSL